MRDLVREGVPVTVVSADRRLDRLGLLLADAELAALDIVELDINELDRLERILAA